MAGIEEYLNKIKNAVYGKEVRQAIHDGIHQCYEDGKAGAIDLVAREEIAQLIAPSGEAPSAAEVTDARVGADGVTYTSLGIANRTQLTKINEGNYLYTIVDGEYVDSASDGSFKPYATFSRTGYIEIDGMNDLFIYSGGSSVYNAFYDENENFIKGFSLKAGDNVIFIPDNAKYYAVSMVTSQLKNTLIKNPSWNMCNKANIVTGNAPNLADISTVIIGQNWTQGSASNRAILWVKCLPNTKYFVYIPPSGYFADVSVVQKAAKAGNALKSETFSNDSTNTVETVENANLLCIQFNGNSDITSSAFYNYNLYVVRSDQRYTAIDYFARSIIQKQRKYIFIGDSYCEGYNPDGNTTGWGDRLKTAMGLSDSNCIVKYQGGTGFYHVSNGKTFSTLLDEAGAEIDKDTITDIVVCGGWNDNSESISNVYNAILAFIAKVRSEYPNAKLYVGMIGASNDSPVKQRLQDTVLYSYQYGALANNCNYLNNVEYALSESNLASDGIHPNADGQVQITIAIKQAIETGSAYIPYRFYTQIKTS